MAEWTGLEPATPCVTGRYSNQLNYHSVTGAGTKSRTRDLLITSQLLYQLSYTGKLVGVVGFEPTTSWSQTKRTTKLCYTPTGGKGGIRTHGRVSPTLVFKTRALNHSATFPGADRENRTPLFTAWKAGDSP